MNIQEFLPELMVNDITKTILFYQELFNAKLITSEEEENRVVWAKVSLGEKIQMSFKSKEKLGNEYDFFRDIDTGGSFSLCFSTSHIKELYEKVSSLAEVINPLHETECKLLEFSIRDNNGYMLTFLEG